MNPSFPKVLMVGTDPSMRGGIASVISGYISSKLFQKLNIDYVSTHINGKSFLKVVHFIKSFFRVVFYLHSYSLLHIHTASWWSFRRLSTIMFISILYRVPYIIHLHGGMFHIYYDNSCNLEKSFIKFYLNRAKSIIVLSQHWKLFTETVSTNKNICIIPNSVQIPHDLSHPHNEQYQKPFQIIFLGTIGYNKGILDILEAAYILKDWPIKFLFGGDGNIDRFQKIVNDKEIEDKVEFLGWVRGKDKNTLLQNADIFLLPSYNEGLPVSLLEAMSYGIPPITTNVGGIPTLINDGQNGLIVPTGNPQAIANSIQKLIQDKNLWECISMNAFETIQSNFSMKSTERLIKECYQAAMKNESTTTIHK